jgi:hypothetical protein
VFNKREIDALFLDLRKEWYKTPEWEYLNRQAHLALASEDSGRSLDGIDARVVTLMGKYRPKG